MTPTSVLVSWSAWGGTQPIFYITNHRVTGNTAWIPNPLGLTQNTSQPITGLTGSTGYDVRLQGSNAAGVAFSAVFTFTTAFGGVVVRNVDVPAEWRGLFVVSRDVVVPAEFGLSTFTVATNVPVNAEWIGPTGVVRDFTIPLEFRLGTTFSRDFAIGVEWGGQPGVSRDFAVPVDIGSTPLAPPLQTQNLALSSPTTTSLLATWDDLITGPPVQGYTLEWKRSTDPVSSFLVVVPSIAEPVTPFAVSRTFAVPMEYAGHVTFSRDVDVPVEWGGAKGASRDFVVPVEFGGATVRIVDASVPVEFRGSTQNVTRDFVVPLERKTTTRRDTLIGVEFRLTPAGPPPAAFYVEIDLGDGSTITDPATSITWGLANQSGGVATINSVPNAASAPTDILVRTFSPDVIWIRDAAHPLLWRSWNGTSAWIPAAGTSDPRYTNVPPLAVTGLAAAQGTTSATLTWGFGNFTTIVGGGFLIRLKRSVDSFYGSDIVQPCVGPSVGQFVDTSGRVFSVNSAGRVVVDGTPDLSSSTVAQLVYRNSQYWYHNTAGSWFFKALITDSWASVATLTAIFVPSTATITMTNGHVLSITSDGRIQDNSVDIPGGSGSAAFTYDPAINRIYGLDAGGTGWYYYAGSGSWLNTADPTGVPPMGAVVSNLLGGTSYDFQVQPFNIAGSGPNTNVTQTTFSSPVPGSPTNLTFVNATSSSVTLSWTPPTSGGALDNGSYRVTTSPVTSTTSIPYCTPSSGSVIDGFGNVWTIAASGGGQSNAVMVNGVFSNGWNALFVLLVGGVVYHQNTSATWYGYTPAASSINGASVAWGNGSQTSPLTAVVVGGLAAATNYTCSVVAFNTAGASPAATVNAATLGASVGRWMNHFAFGGNEFYLSFVNEQEYMCDNGSGHTSSTGYNPFTVSGSVLFITAQTTTKSGFSNPASQPWNSGCITSCTEVNSEPTAGLFSQRSGYFEMRCRVPSGGPANGGPGFWPAFVLYPLAVLTNGVYTNPPGEIDIFEILGGSTGTVRQSIHSSVAGANHEYDYTGAGDVSLAFHTYGVDVQSNFITFYVDNVQTAQQATPSDFVGNNWYINAPFSVGGPTSWSGATSVSVGTDTGVWQIDYVGAWASRALAYPGGTLSKPAALFLDDFNALNVDFNGAAPSAPTPLFSEDFTTLALYDYHSPAAGSVWMPASWFGAGRDGEDSAGTWSVNPFITVPTPVQPFTVSGGILSMRLDKTPAADLAAFGNDATFGGALQTNPTFQGGPFGYWEIRCAVPAVLGSQFGFAIYDSSGQQELDLAIPTLQNGFQFAKLNLWTTTPTKALNNFFFSYNMANPIDPRQFHTYGIDLQPTTSAFYIDRVQVMQFATPATYSQPMFWVLGYSNAVDEGGGQPLQSALPSFALIDYVKTWRAPPF